MKIKRSGADYFLDITEDVCPMTFVKVRLQIEKMSMNETLEVLLKGAEPLRNVPESVTELGHAVLSVNPESPARAADEGKPDRTVYRIIVRKS